VSELRVWWILVCIFCTLAPIILISLLFTTAPYGRFGRKGWGPEIDATAGWVAMELPAVLVVGGCFLSSSRWDAASVLFVALWELHYVQRALVFPFLRRGGAKTMPFAVAAMAVAFNGMNGYLNGRGIFALAPPRGAAWLADPRLLVGVALFLGGMAINWQSDRILRGLRAPGDTGYHVPRGGLYRFISCPNYFGEIVEWTGWAIATWSPAGAAFALWTFANLAPRALASHRWYRAQFADYPRERKALIPFVI
jgi:protein-S-isoprenylcysteine O-methyltransferase Ste14